MIAWVTIPKSTSAIFVHAELRPLDDVLVWQPDPAVGALSIALPDLFTEVPDLA